ncbi:type II toxin-antitoxin system antitoxin DNA ADP-ribosyl glycohydrolase DarG [Actinopolyspora sp. H202]|uniref:type II toxin-antitoxin system antitoxin DNA ADP-ribosyl glycohydrolase DarG n=1 Tax=Actinopolyspora sp. H202 TaxID=1500456 RepID=UPI003EE58624
MIKESHGDLLNAEADALVNPVNTVGVMGKGIALQFRRRYPEMYRAYAAAAERGELRLGRMHVWETGVLTGPRLVINFPTKKHWRSRSRLADIETGLSDLERVLHEYAVTSVAVPPLGCGNGGLGWENVCPLIVRTFERMSGIEARIFSPEGAPSASEMVTRTERPDLTVGRAALLTLLRRYEAVAMGVSQLEVQKLMYFLQQAGENLRLEYGKGRYGPYADNLRRVLNMLEGHFTVGYGDGSKPVNEAEPIELLPDAAAEAERALRGAPETRERIDRVLRLSEGFESAYSMELLASVHWSTIEDPRAAERPEAAIEFVRGWNARKKRLLTPEHITTAWHRLRSEGWLPSGGPCGR